MNMLVVTAENSFPPPAFFLIQVLVLQGNAWSLKQHNFCLGIWWVHRIGLSSPMTSKKCIHLLIKYPNATCVL